MKGVYLLFIFLLLFASGCSTSKDDTTKVKKQSHEQDHHSPSKKKKQTTKSAQPPEKVKFTPEEYRERLRQVAKEYGMFDVSFLTEDMESLTKSKEPIKGVEPDEVLTGIIPNRLQIPSISLDAPVKEVGVLKNGQMKVPDDFSKVGLFAPWTKPGEKGSAVIAGHFDHYTGPAVFYHLKKIRPGDRVIVSDSKGNKRIFTVTNVERFKTHEAPKTRIFKESDQPHLNLITCSGKYNRKTGDRPRRLVVFTILEKEAS
jgi:LPXTG-site transpeptidase (sortase) family protein